jgi:hypothetical protein
MRPEAARKRKSGRWRSNMLMFSELAIAGLGLVIWRKVIEKRSGGYLHNKQAQAGP